MTEKEDGLIAHSWHDQSVGSAMSTLKATDTGLSEAEAQERLGIYGFNRLPELQKKSVLLRFLLLCITGRSS
jgi:magnesium-transporting ATPase (P-type)